MSRSISTFDRGVRISDRAISRARIPESAIHHWPLTEGSGSTATDVIGGEHGDIVGATWNENNEFFDGAALEFDGTDDHIATSLNCVDLSSPITLAVTAVPFEIGEGDLFHAYESNVDTRWTLSYDRDGNQTFGWVGHESDDNIVTTNPVDPHTRVRVAVAHDLDSSTVQIYENGILADSSSNLDKDVTIDELLHINTNPSRHDTPFGGFIRNPIIYDSVLSKSKVESDFSHFSS